MSTPETLALAEQARTAWDRFMAPAFAVCRDDYREKLTKLYAELDDAKVERHRAKLALALRVLDEVEGQLQALIASGEAARHDQKRADRVASLPAHKKLGIALS